MNMKIPLLASCDTKSQNAEKGTGAYMQICLLHIVRATLLYCTGCGTLCTIAVYVIKIILFYIHSMYVIFPYNTMLYERI